MPIILAPPGCGKSHWVALERTRALYNAQDMDVLYGDTLHSMQWHDTVHSMKEEQKHYEVIDEQNTKNTRCMNIIGSLWWDIKPDAVVITPQKTHKARVLQREDLQWERVASLTQALIDHAIKNNIPIYTTFEEAAALHFTKVKVEIIDRAIKQ